MVSRDNVIETNTKCSCGNGDLSKAQKNYFENKCANCGKEGTLQVETINNVEVDNHANSNADKNNTTETTNNTNSSLENEAPATKIVCKNCGSEYCGQDGYDMIGGTRSGLNSVNPNDITEDEEEGDPSSQDEDEPTYMSGWEGLCDLLKPLDAQAMMVQRGDFVIIKKIELPQSAQLWAYEGINVVDDSVTITDYTPEIYNTFIIKWGETFENEMEFVIDDHKKLFGERKIVVEAKKIQVVEDESEDEDGDSSSDDKTKTKTNSNSNSNDKKSEEEEEDTKSHGNLWSWIFGKDDETKKMKNLYDGTEKFDTDKTDSDKINTGDLGSLDESDVTTGQGEQDVPQTEEVPITTREEAKQFGMTEVGKAKREDGHTIELKVIGSSKFQMGEWCHVRLPSFNEDSYMFISKCSFESSPDNEYITSLTLVDYPPSLGKKSKKSDENANADGTETTDGTNPDGTTTDPNSTDSNSTTGTDGNTDSNSSSSSSSSSGNATTTG